MKEGGRRLSFCFFFYPWLCFPLQKRSSLGLIQQMTPMSPNAAAFVLRLLLCAALCYLQPWVSADRDYFEVLQECSSRPFTCGDYSINVSYPFSFDAPDYCGHPAFRLQCNGTIPAITISMADNKTYAVRDIDYDKSMLTLFDQALRYLSQEFYVPFENYCIPFRDTIIDPLLFEFTDLDLQCSEYLSGSLTIVDRCLNNTTLTYMYISRQRMLACLRKWPHAADLIGIS